MAATLGPTAPCLAPSPLRLLWPTRVAAPSAAPAARGTSATLAGTARPNQRTLAAVASCAFAALPKARRLVRRRCGAAKAAASGTRSQSTYVKVWVNKVHWVGETGVLLQLQQVYSPVGNLPSTFSCLLASEDADMLQRALFGKVPEDLGGDDGVCEVRVHSSCTGNVDSANDCDSSGELVLREGCQIFFGDELQPQQLEARDQRERRIGCPVGEALGIAHRLSVPVLICTDFVLQAAKVALDRYALEDLCSDDAACDVELQELSHRVGCCLISRQDEDAKEFDTRGPVVGDLLHDLDAFAWFWALHSGVVETQRQPFGDFRAKYKRVASS